MSYGIGLARNDIRRLALASVSGSALLLAGASIASAQDATPETVTVTGSLIISNVANSPTPLTVVSADQLEATTPSNIPDGLNKLPIFLGSNSPRTSSNANANNAGDVLNFRDFGPNRTLVLFDGHRVAPSNFNGTVDTDVLPQMLVSRVDVVTGGASAVYGSDAVTGVVNFVLDKHFSGVKYNASAGISNYTDAAQFQGGVAAGTDLFGGRGHLEVSLRYFHQDKVPMTDRPYNSNLQAWSRAGAGTAANPYVNVEYGRLPLQAEEGGIVTCNGCAANNTTFISNGVLGPFDPGTPTTTKGLNSGGDGGGYFKTSSFAASLRTADAFTRFSYDIDDTTTAYVDLTAAESGNLADWSASTINPGTGRGSVLCTCNAYLSASAAALLMSGNTTNTFNMATFFDTVGGESAPRSGNDFRTGAVDRNLNVTTGLDGTAFGKYNWDLYYTHGESRQEGYTPHNANVEKFLAAEDAVLNPAGQVVCNVSLTAYANLYPGCVPLNPFGPTSLTTAQFDYFTDRTSYVATNVMDDVGGSVAGEVFELPAGPVKAALSAEARWQSLTVESAFNPQKTVDCTGLRSFLCVQGVAALYDQPITAPVAASMNVYEFATEVNVPILKDIPLVQNLDVDLAGRYTDYSTSGSAETWKIGLDYHVNDSIRFRSTMSVDIRAPNLYDLDMPLSIKTAGFADLLTGGNLSITSISQGNSTLTPEVAHTFTVGTVLTPSFIPRLTVSLDYYKINMSNAITSLSGSSADIQTICNASNGTSSYCQLIARPYPYGSPQYTTLANFPTAFYTESINSAKVRTEGTDIEIDYNFDMSDISDDLPGTVNLRNLGTIQPYINTVNYPGAPIALTAVPRARVTNFFSYDVGRWEINLQNTWMGGFSKKTLLSQVFVQPHANAFDTLDVTIDKKYDVDGGPMDIYFSVQNVANSQPPLVTTTSSSPGLSYPVVASENAMGRYFIIGIKGAL